MSRYATTDDLIPEPCRVLGTMLRPFSLGHHLLLVKFGSRFANFLFNFDNAEQKEAALASLADCTSDDLAIAVFICAASYSDTLESQWRDEWASEFKSWQNKIRPRRFRRLFNIPKEVHTFAEYLAAGYKRPPVWRHEITCGISISSPWEQLLKVRLVQSGFSETEALEKYLPEAWYDYFTAMEIKQAAECVDVRTWRKVFYTRDDAERLAR